MLNKSIFSLYLISLSVGIFAQSSTKLSLLLRSRLERLSPEEKGSMVVATRNLDFASYLTAHNLRFDKYNSVFYNITGNRLQLLDVAAQAEIEWIEIGSGSPQLLNDSMVSNNRVIRVHNGTAPLASDYTGKGVVLGFIDTGIDYSHPDFNDASNKTRVLKIWDQNAATTIPSRVPSFGYGQVWDSTDINMGLCPHDDDVLSHGTNVAGIAAGNGLALNKYAGVAPEADVIFVASNFNAFDWLQTVADGVEFIFNEADVQGKPCVINISAGDYLGSHDGTDLAAVRINDLIKAGKGRAVVAAAGNSGNLFYHLGYVINSDTSFTWFQHSNSTIIGLPGVYFQLWADTAAFSQVKFSVRANLPGPSYSFRGRTKFDGIGNRLNIVVKDTILNGGNRLAFVETFATVIGGTYFMEVFLNNPDSNQYLFGFTTTGNGHLDVWSDTWIGTSHMVKSPLPTSAVYPDIIHYKQPDTLQTIVSSFTCLPNVITVGNYINRNSYLDYDTVLRTFAVTPGQKADNSSLGPNRLGQQKPDLTASGDYTLTTNRLASIPLHLANNQADRIALGGMHKRNGGTSMASPAVAGTVALMLEQCSDLDYSAIRQRIIDSVFNDNFTSASVPNFSYGYGKLNAFGALSGQAYRPEILPVGTVYLCAGDLLHISCQSGLAHYSWSNGLTSSTFLTDTSGTYVVETVNSDGCIGISDTVVVIKKALPVKPSITKLPLNQLKSSPAAQYQWYVNGGIILGAQNQTLKLTSNGSYNVEVSDAFYCKTLSDPFIAEVGIRDKNENIEFQVFPVPSADGIYYVKCESCEEMNAVQLKVSDLVGQVVYQSLIHIPGSLDIHHISAGQYQLSMYYNGEILMRQQIIKGN